jgi:hypothetical protein
MLRWEELVGFEGGRGAASRGAASNPPRHDPVCGSFPGQASQRGGAPRKIPSVWAEKQVVGGR